MSTQAPVPFFQSSFIERDGNFWMTARDISVALGYADQTKVINLHNRHSQQFQEFTTILKLRGVDGKSREHRIFSEEGIYLIAMYANTPKAREFQIAVAKFLKEQRLNRLKEAKLSGMREVLSLCPPKHTRLIKYRRAGLSQREAARALGISRTTVQRMEKALKPLMEG